MKAIIATVYPEPRKWEGPNGTVFFIKAIFSDQSSADAGAKTEQSARQYIEALRALIGEEHEYEVERKPNDFEGHPSYKLKSWPGKEKGYGGAGGGKGSYVPAFHQTAEGCAYEQERMDRRTALMQAVASMNLPATRQEGVAEEVLCRLADLLYAWLRATCPPTAVQPVKAPEPTQSPVTPTEGNETPKNGSLKGIKYEGPTGSLCSRCHAPVGSPHGKVCW
jgi:hypothetical protein